MQPHQSFFEGHIVLKSLSPQEHAAIRDLGAMYRQIGIDGEPPMWNDPFLFDALASMADPKEVVDIGCGTGRVIPLMDQLGIKKYFGIDPMEACVQHCKAKYPEHNFEVNEVRQLGAKYPGRFNGFLLLAVLNHIPRGHLNAVLQSIHKCLVPNAPGAIILNLGVPGRLMANVGGVKITMYTHDEIKDGLARNGFKITDEIIRYPYENNIGELRILVERDGQM